MCWSWRWKKEREKFRDDTPNRRWWWWGSRVDDIFGSRGGERKWRDGLWVESRETKLSFLKHREERDERKGLQDQPIRLPFYVSFAFFSLHILCASGGIICFPFLFLTEWLTLLLYVTLQVRRERMDEREWNERKRKREQRLHGKSESGEFPAFFLRSNGATAFCVLDVGTRNDSHGTSESSSLILRNIASWDDR